MNTELNNKVVLITGATGGIGQALVHAFAAEGCRLAISSTKQEKLDQLVPTLNLPADHLMTFVTDVTKEADVKDMVEKTVVRYGSLDVLVNNAGYEGKNQPITDAVLADYLKVYQVNVFGPMYTMKYAARQMLLQGSGTMVNIASNGSYTGAPGMGAYCSSKHALAGLVKSVALELAPKGIRVNYICPGAVETPMIHRIEKATFGDSVSHEEAIKIYSAGYPDGRYCKPSEVADLAVYLASARSGHLIGSGIRLDGGMDATC
jgi:NAD(P)-dependent dehydrogenase (short-subunit alcohol dehydrogenase family)